MECTYDRLELFDGDDASARQLGRLCGSGLPNPVVSSSNRLYMTFYTDASVQRKGFDIAHTTGIRGFSRSLLHSNFWVARHFLYKPREPVNWFIGDLG